MADDNTKLIIVLEAQSKKLQNSLVQVNRQIDRFAQQTERRFDQMQKRNAASFDKLGTSVRNSMGGLQNILGPLIGSLGAREVLHYADAWQEAQNKIAAASQVSGLQARSLDEIKDSANGARTELASYVDLYSRLLRVAPGVAATEIEVARATDIVAKSLKAGGASAQEQQASLIQLGQAIGSGILQGDELRSLRENAPLVAKAIADEFGVTIGQLKALGAEGKLTSDRVFQAILNGGEEIEAAFKATQSTIKDAFSRIDNEFTAYIGTAGQATGATQALIDALNYVAEHFQKIAPAVAQFAAILAGAFAGRLILVPIAQATVALGTFLAALATGTLTAVTFSAALGPIALLAGAAAAAYALMVYAEGDAARVAAAHSEALVTNQEKLDLARDASDEYRKALQRQIAVQLAAADASLVEADAQLQAARTKAQAAGLLTALFGLGVDILGGDTSDINPDAVSDEVTKEAEAKVAAAKARIADLRRQLAEIDTIRLTPEGDGDRPTKPGSAGSGKQSEYEKAIESIAKRTAALQAETAAQAGLNPLINDYGFALEKAKAEHDLLTAAHEAGIAVTPELEAAIASLATGYANASVEAKKLAEEQDKARESAAEFFSSAKDMARGFIDDLVAGKTAAEALGNALSNIGNKLIDMGFDAIFGTGGKDFGALGKLFGFAKGGIAANGRPKMFANGGVSKTAAIFGEGPMAEAAVPLPDGRRIPVDLRMPTRGSGGNSMAVPININIDATGADAAGLARVQQQLAVLQVELPGRVKRIVKGRGKDWI